MAERASKSVKEAAQKTVKSPDAFRTISEVSDELDLPQHVLRFWETRFTQIRPLKRGGGRRLYRPDHVALLRGIRSLLYDDGLTIKGVQKVLRDRGIKAVIARGAGEEAEEVSPGEVAERLSELKKRVDAAEQGEVVTSAHLQESIDRLEKLLIRLEQD
ncbi:MAG: MerR family transcriptional regulator [Pseudomonadota bacterium]